MLTSGNQAYAAMLVSCLEDRLCYSNGVFSCNFLAFEATSPAVQAALRAAILSVQEPMLHSIGVAMQEAKS